MDENKPGMENNAPASPTPPAASTPPANTNGSYGSGYGKSSWKKWVLIYVIIAVVLYGLIYWWYSNSKSTNSTGATNNGSIY